MSRRELLRRTSEAEARRGMTAVATGRLLASSGYGRTKGLETLLDYARVKSISVALSLEAD